MANDKLVSRLLLIGLAVVILSVLIAQYRKSPSKQGQPIYGPMGREMFSVPSPVQAQHFTSQSASVKAGAGAGAVTQETINGVQPSEPLQNEMYKSVNYSSSSSSGTESCAPRDKVTAEDLLPKDAANSKWAQVSPAGQGDVTDQNFLTAGYLVGVNTVGESLRNANYQLRSDPPIERVNVGPWQMSTIEGENRRYLEIGC